MTNGPKANSCQYCGGALLLLAARCRSCNQPDASYPPFRAHLVDGNGVEEFIVTPVEQATWQPGDPVLREEVNKVNVCPSCGTSWTADIEACPSETCAHPRAIATALWCDHSGNRSRCLPCFQSDVLALCRDHQGMSAHMLAEAIADLCGVDLRAEARAESDDGIHPSFYETENF